MDASELILYQTEDGRIAIHLRAEEATLWLNQAEIAELFATTKQNVSLHARNILKYSELSQDLVVKESLTTAAVGHASVSTDDQHLGLLCDTSV